MPDASFFDFVVQLVKLGGLGIGALIFVMVFIILFRNQPADAATARLRSQFLIWGGSFALVALVVSTTTTFLRPPVAPSKFRLGITVSPDFGEAKLPDPEFALMPAGVPVRAGQPVDITSDTTLSIKVKGIVSSVQALSQSSENLLQTNKQLTQAVEAAIKPTPVGSVAPPPPITAHELKTIRDSQEEIRRNIIVGDFNRAAVTSLNTRNFTAQAIKPGLHPVPPQH